MANNNNNAGTGNNLPVAPPTAPKSIWVKQAEEAKLKSDAEKDAAAKAAFEATFNQSQQTQPLLTQTADAQSSSDSDDDDDDKSYRKNRPAGPVDPAKCTANGAGIAGGTACVGATFTVVAKDSEGQKVDKGGAEVKVRVKPGVGVGGNDQEGIVKDLGDGSYSVTYVVPKRGNYMVSVECNGRAIMGSPFPVFFSAGAPAGVLGINPAATYPSLVNQTMPNMPNYSGSVSGAFPGLLGMIPGVVAGASGGVVLPGMGSALGEICREYVNGRCAATDCKFSHPAHNLIMTAISTTPTVGGTYNQVSPSAAAMAAAQAIVAAQTLQAHALAQAKAQSKKDPAAEKEANADSLRRTVQVSNLSPLLTVDQLKQLFGFYGTVVECTITDSKHFAYIEYSKPEEAAAALASNNMDLAGRPLNVEMAKSLPPKTLNSASSSMMQHVAMQQMQFQQALLMQQSLTAQQAANRAATMKSATDLAAARAAEISKKLKAEGLITEEKVPDKESGSPSTTRLKSRSRSRSKSSSPINYRLRRRSRSFSPPIRRGRGYRSKSPLRNRHYSSYEKERRYYRDSKDDSYRNRRRDSGRSHDKRSPATRRNRSRSITPRPKKSHRDDSASPKHRESPTERSRKSARGDSTSPRPHKRRSPSSGDDNSKLKHRRRSRSRSGEINHPSSDKKDVRSREKSKNRTGRRSRSHSREDHKRRSPSSGEDNGKSKHRRRSRSRSGEAKNQTSDKKDLKNRDKPKNRSGRKSRSHSPEDRNHGNRSPRRVSDESRSRHKRRSRSRSLETKTRSTDKLERGREDRHRDRKRSALRSTEGKRQKARETSPDSPQHSDDHKSEGRKHSRSNSREHGHTINQSKSNPEELEQANERSVALENFSGQLE